MTHTYRTRGTCSKQITFDLNDGIVSNVSFVGGCNGNLQGVGRLVEGQKAEELVAKLKGINCGGKGTSCPDQLARAIEIALAGKEG
ncbi:MAG: TIGR03905 family TSCPD domain-containing protein [Lachnospiraceae bacterium]|nr:TIGR03905 family TSCPD domain-containing protein [Lachnospiraceae bacterium]